MPRTGCFDESAAGYGCTFYRIVGRRARANRAERYITGFDVCWKNVEALPHASRDSALIAFE